MSSSPSQNAARHGGDLVARVLETQGVRFLFTLCGGHISPILVGAKARGIRVIDVQPDVMTARVDGQRTKLYLNEPSEPGGLTYLAPLGGGCAWVGMPDTEVRFSVCKGKTERL